MNRKEEYRNLLEELESTPTELDYTLTRAQAKLKNSRKHQLWRGCLRGLTGFCLIFVLLVNCSTTFAYTCGRIPIIKALAQFVAFSPSLSAAVDNQYVQPMALEVTQEDITARVEYVIVDQKQLNIFYSLDSKLYTALQATPSIRKEGGEPLEGYGLSSGESNVCNDALRHITVDFIEEDMPSSMELHLEIDDVGSFIKTEVIQEEPVQEKEKSDSTKVTEISFLLEFDPYYTAQGETITLNQAFEIDGQILELTTVDIYPTHIRINLDDQAENTAWLQSLTFYLTNEKGKRYEAISNGITATGDQDSPMMVSHRLESSFFSDAQSLILHITDVTWLNKNMEKVKVDLKNKTAEAMPEGVVFERADRKGEDWLLTFSAKKLKGNAGYQLWNQTYYDEHNHVYHYNSWSTHTRFYDEETDERIEKPDTFEVAFALENYPYDTVYLSPAYSCRVHLEEPITLKIK